MVENEKIYSFKWKLGFIISRGIMWGRHKSAAVATVAEISKEELIKKINDIISERL